MVKRIDPKGCGCTDCLVGWSRPLDQASEFDLAMAAAGFIQNASGCDIELEAKTQIKVTPS